MNKKSIGKNFIYNLLVQLVTILAPLVTAPYVSRVLTVDGVGRFSFTFSNVSYFVILATLGTTVYAQREVAAHCNDKEEVSRIFAESIILRAVTVLVATAAYIPVCMLSGWSRIVLIQGLNIIGVLFDITWLFQGLEEFKRTAFRTMVIKLGFIAFIFIFVKDRSHLELYTFGYAIMQIAANLVLWFYLPSYIVKVKPDLKRAFKRLWPAFLLFVPTVATQVYTVLDKSMIGFFTDTDYQNGLYEWAEKISRISLTIYTAYGAVVTPRIASLYSDKNDANSREKAREILDNSIHVMWGIVLPMTVGVFVIAPSLIPWFLGETYLESVPILQVFAFLLIPVGLSNVFAVQYLVPSKKQNVFTVSVASGAVLNLCMNLILIPRMYALGAALASVTAECVITGIQFIYVTFIDKSFSVRRVFAPMVKYLVMSLVMGVVTFLLVANLSATIINTIIICAAGVAVYGLMLLVTKDDLIARIRRK